MAELEGREGAPPAQPLSQMQRRMGLGHQGDTAGKVSNFLDQLPYDAGSSVSDAATKVGLSPETSAVLGTGTNFGMQVLPMLFGGEAAKAASPSFQAGAKSIMQSAIKPLWGDLKSGDGAKAIETMLREGINPTQGGMTKLNSIVGDLDAQVKALIANSNASVNKGNVGTRLMDTWDRFKNQVNPQSDLEAIKEAWLNFRNHPALSGVTDFPVQLAQQLKSGTYRTLGEKAYGEVGSASTEAQKALARGLREEVANAVPEIQVPLAREASLMNVRDIAERRALMDSNKNPVSLPTSIAAASNNPLAAAGMWLNTSTPAKAWLARALYSGSEQIPATAARVGIAGVSGPNAYAPPELTADNPAMLGRLLRKTVP